MPINVPSRDALANRQARPLNGVEVAKAIENHLLTLSTRLLDNAGVLSDEMLVLQDQLNQSFRSAIHFQSRLQKIHLTYPKVGWSIKLRLEKNETDPFSQLTADIEVDLERNVRINIQVGRSSGMVISSMDEEKIPTSIPDRDRQKFELPVTAEFLKPDGTVGKVDLNEIKPQERRAARTVDVGSGAEKREARQIPIAPFLDEATGEIVTTTEVFVAGGQQGDIITLPDPNVEISLDDLMATPPTPEKEPITTPTPVVNPMSKIQRPNVKFKR